MRERRRREQAREAKKGGGAGHLTLSYRRVKWIIYGEQTIHDRG
jgi:hypothetical protein